MFNGIIFHHRKQCLRPSSKYCKSEKGRTVLILGQLCRQTSRVYVPDHAFLKTDLQFGMFFFRPREIWALQRHSELHVCICWWVRAILRFQAQYTLICSYDSYVYAYPNSILVKLETMTSFLTVSKAYVLAHVCCGLSYSSFTRSFLTNTTMPQGKCAKAISPLPWEMIFGGSRYPKISFQNLFFWTVFFNRPLMSQNHFGHMFHFGTSDTSKSFTLTHQKNFPRMSAELPKSFH